MNTLLYQQESFRGQRSDASTGLDARNVKNRLVAWCERGQRSMSRWVPGMRADRRMTRFIERAALRDGTAVCIRAIRPDDKKRFQDAFARLSAKSVYQRLLHTVTELT